MELHRMTCCAQLPSLRMMFLRIVYAGVCLRPFFYDLSISLEGWTSLVYPSSVDGHLGSFYFLVIVTQCCYEHLCTSAGMDIYFLFSWYIPRVELLGRMVVLYLAFKKPLGYFA